MQGLSVKPRAHHTASLTSQAPVGTPLVSAFQCCATFTWHSSGDLNSGPRAWAASTLTTEPPPHPSCMCSYPFLGALPHYHPPMSPPQAHWVSFAPHILSPSLVLLLCSTALSSETVSVGFCLSDAYRTVKRTNQALSLKQSPYSD